jgi:hypothetical protein
MRALSTRTALPAVIGLGAVAIMLAPSARADDWSIGVGLGLPGVVIVQPAPVYGPPPRYYVPPPYYYTPPYYYAPGYYRPPLIGYGEYGDEYVRDHGRHHRHEADEDDED